MSTPHLFTPADGDAYEQAQRIASITWEFSEFMVDGLGIANLDLTLPEKQSFAIHDACHGLRGLGLGAAARELIAHLGNAELAELNECEVWLRLWRPVQREDARAKQCDAAEQSEEYRRC